MYCWVDNVEVGDEAIPNELVDDDEFGWVHHSRSHGWHTLDEKLLKLTKDGFQRREAKPHPKPPGVPSLPDAASNPLAIEE